MDVVTRYFALATRPDADAYVALFTDDAVVEDEHREHHGTAAIRAWRAGVPPVRYSVLSTSPGPGARVQVSGGFPGSPVTLTFRFGLAADGRIERLTIRP